MHKISGVILAGGLGRRMGGVDKGRQKLDDRPLISWVIERFAPQVDQLLINANQNLADYRALGYPVMSDLISGYCGPLAGLHVALQNAQYPLLACVPCDAPFLPDDLVCRLSAELADADIAVARTAQQIQPVFMLCRCSVLPNLSEYLQQGGRKVMEWYRQLRYVEVSFAQETSFANFNTLESLSEYRVLKSDSSG